MFFIPFYKKIDWRKPPLVTLLLVLINCAIYFSFQLNDQINAMAAYQFYFDSELADIELPIVIDSLETQNNEELHRQASDAWERRENLDLLLNLMLKNHEFQKKVRQRALLEKNASQYTTWVELREQFENKLNKVVWYRLGLKPAEPTAITLFSHMFLHGGLDHLLGNMLFLFLIGFAVETIIGSRQYLVAYLLAGLASAIPDVTLHSNSYTSSIGASGAIAGLMGMYTVLFGLRKIYFFYFVFVYFNFVRAPAILLLPIWMGHEIYQLLLSGNQGVNYMAHIGGLAAGAVIAYGLRAMTQSVDTEYMDEETTSSAYAQEFEQAMNFMSQLKYDKARNIFAKLLKERPTDPDLLAQLYNISKSNPSGLHFHIYANKILALPHLDPKTEKLVLETYTEYTKLSENKIQTKPEVLISLANRFIRSGQLQLAEQIIAGLIRNKIFAPHFPQAVLALAFAQYKHNNKEKCHQCLNYLIRNFAATSEASQAQSFLNQISVSS